MRLEHPLLGRDRRLTALAAGFCGALVVLSLATAAASAGAIGGRSWVFVGAIDGVTGLVILGVLLATTAVPMAYGLANGGPAMAVTIAVTPHLAALAVTFRLAVTIDLTVALVAGALGATVAAGVGWVRGGDVTVTPPSGADVDGLLVASAVAVLAAIASRRFLTTAPPDQVATVESLAWLAAIPPIGCALLWVTWAWIDRGGSHV